MLRVFSFAMALALVSLTWAATAKKTPAKKSPAKTSAARSGSKKSASKKGSSKKASARATTWRNRQIAPTPQRYKEIQEALAAKGYLQAEEATGVWSQTSIEALKRFQSEQNLQATGKINSLSLIALGLGPKREAAVKPPAPPPAQ